MKNRITLVLGARPQIIKSAPLIHLASKDPEIYFEIVHTGQHYDYEMTKVFFEELNIPDPILNLEVGSGTHAWQTAEIMIRLCARTQLGANQLIGANAHKIVKTAKEVIENEEQINEKLENLQTPSVTEKPHKKY